MGFYIKLKGTFASVPFFLGRGVCRCYMCVILGGLRRGLFKGVLRQKFFRRDSKKEMFFKQVLHQMKEDFTIMFVEGLGCGVLRRDLRWKSSSRGVLRRKGSSVGFYTEWKKTFALVLLAAGPRCVFLEGHGRDALGGVLRRQGSSEGFYTE